MESKEAEIDASKGELSQDERNWMLLDSIKRGDVFTIRSALLQGADIHFESELPLREAALYEYEEIFRHLLKAGADFEKALGRAAGAGDLTVVTKLIEYASTPSQKHVVKTLRAAFSKKSRKKSSARKTKKAAPSDWIDRVNEVRKIRNRFIKR